LELKTKLLTDGYLEAEEVQTTKADGSISFGLTSARQLDIDGRKCAVTAWQDITKLKRAEAALRAAHKRFDEAMAVIPVVIWWVTFDQGKATDAYISLEVDRILRLPEGTLRNDWDGLMARIHPEDIAHVQHEIALSFQHPGTNHQVEYRLQRADGTSAWIRTSGVGRLGPNGTIHGFGISEDITAQRLAAAEQERLAQQLQQSQKLESLGRLAGGIAHDFNNILTAILGNLDLVTMQLEPGDPRLARLREAHSAGRKAADLTRHLLALSRQKIIEPRVVDLNELVDNASRLLERLLGENIRLRKVLHANLWSVKVDPNQIEQVLINLAVNARDAMPEGGTLTLETSHVQLDKTYCENHPEATVGPHVMLAVSDTGCGMTPEVKASVFEPFFTTKPPGQGTGLGLAMVHGLIRQHGGSIAFYSEPGQGTTFKVYLPALHVKPTSLGLSTHLPTVKGGTETIFLVEDDEGVRRLAGDVLSQLGYRIFSFESVSSALEAASCHNGEIDLLLTDVVLPEHNGRWLADQLLSLFPTMKVLFSSGYTADVIVHHGVLEENIHFLEKPYSTDALAIAVRRILDGEELVRLATAL
jgi:signal transduction histidine kinase/ActR/RegA family two-component response regulator